jgi:hypothetical protein
MVVLADDRQSLHVEPRLLKLLESSLCAGMRVIDSDDGIFLVAWSHGDWVLSSLSRFFDCFQTIA